MRHPEVLCDEAGSSSLSIPIVVRFAKSCQVLLMGVGSCCSCSPFLTLCFFVSHYSIMGNQQSVRHEPSPYSSVTSTTAPKPVRSAMRRSRSIRNQEESDGQTADRTRYIPKMSTAKNGLIMPTRPFGAEAGSNGGMESPQLGYGFYTNLTPPTPEMYQRDVSRTTKLAAGAPALPPQSSMQSSVGRAHHNEVFQNLQNNKGHMGWTSVPI